MKKIVITGANGFIGKNLVSVLSHYDIMGLGEQYLLDSNWRNILIDKLSLFEPDVVFHVGACSDTLETDVNYMMIRNYEATKRIVDWCIQNNVPIVYSSSAANYGTNNSHPSNLYGWSKYVAEDYVVKSGGVALRYFNVYGPGEQNKGKMSSIAFQTYVKHKSGEDIFLFPGEPKRDFVYVKDIVGANLHAWKNYDILRGNFFEVGTAKSRKFEDILEIMEIPYKYFDRDKIPNGYQFYTQSNQEKWMTNWKPNYSLERGLTEYKNFLEETLR